MDSTKLKRKYPLNKKQRKNLVIELDKRFRHFNEHGRYVKY